MFRVCELVCPFRFSFSPRTSSSYAAYSLFLIRLYPRTTLEPSIFGFFTTGAAILFAGTVGSFVDRFARLQFVRGTIVVQKATVAAAYVLFLICFLEIGPQTDSRKRLLDAFFAIITILSALLNLATVSVTFDILTNKELSFRLSSRLVSLSQSKGTG